MRPETKRESRIFRTKQVLPEVDEEYSRMKLDQMAKAPPCFQVRGGFCFVGSFD